MAKAVVTFKLMPESPEIDLEKVKEEALKIARESGAIGDMIGELKDLAFGIKTVMIKGMYEVEGSDFDGIAEKMKEIDNVQSAEVENMDLALG